LNKHYASLSPISFHLNHEILNAERVAEIKAKQYAVLAYTVNDKMRMKELFSWGVDGVFSDCSADFLMGIKKD
jgi:glycerophosphoryl diester phosphodiesterase